VAEYLSPERFAMLAAEARRRGFSAVTSAPFARTSYHAMESAASASGAAPGAPPVNGAAPPNHAD
jgi:lipoic acid synthetase